MRGKILTFTILVSFLITGCESINSSVSAFTGQVQSEISKLGGNNDHSGTTIENASTPPLRSLDDFNTWQQTSTYVKTYTYDGLPLTQFKTAKSDIEGIYVFIHPRKNARMLYITSDLKYSISSIDGWVEISSQKSITDKNQIRELEKNYVLSKLTLSDNFTYKFGAGEQKLILFSGIDCPYSLQTERQLVNAKGLNATVYVAPGVVNLTNKARIQNVLCSPNPIKLWREVMLSNNKKSVAQKSCDQATTQMALNDDLSTLLLNKKLPAVYSISQAQFIEWP